jgi:hypothetical protein
MIYYYTNFPQYEITDIMYGLYAVVMLIDVYWGSFHANQTNCWLTESSNLVQIWNIYIYKHEKIATE